MIRLGKSEKEFHDAYRSYSGNIHRTLKGMIGNDAIAEELTQEAFIKAWKGLPQFGFRSSIKAWLYQVALNVGRDWLRSHKNGKLPVMDENCEDGNETEKMAIQEALLELEEEVRTILVLCYYEGMKQDEISIILKIPEGTVKSRLHSAKKKIKEVLHRKGFDL